MGKGMRAGKRPSGGGGMQKQLQQMQAMLLLRAVEL